MTPHTVKVDNLEIGADTPVRIMGVINLSSESFYSGSVATKTEDIQNMVRQMEKDGANIIDVGGASSAPKSIYGTSDVSLEEELQRVKEGLSAVMEVTNVPVSIDTMSSIVAEMALDLGATLVNDISGLRRDPKMAQLVTKRGVPVVLMALCEKPCAEVQQSIAALRESISIADKAEINKERIIVDPGIGFGKPSEVDNALLRELRQFTMWGHPVLVGISRKAFIGELLSQTDPTDRLVGTIAATSLAVARGAKIVRSHDVAEAQMAAAIGEALSGHTGERDGDADLLGMLKESEAEIIIEQIGTGADIRRALARKAVTLSFLLKTIKTPAALIIKQEMLALGGDAAYHTDVIDSEIERTDVLVMGTLLQLDRFVDKMLRMDYFGLPKIGKSIQILLAKREERLG
ncbi:MAG: dihydropteroate synthase [Candidatus Thorarchaeota archaeon]|jgi:dihydropteroate synthase